MKKYFKLNTDNGFYLNEKGYCKLKNGVMFITNGFEEYANEHGIIYRPNYVSWVLFNYSFKVAFKDYFKHTQNIKVNTRIKIIKDDDESPNFENEPIYIYLSLYERFKLSYIFGKLLIQDKNFWMWFINIVIALGATIAGFLVVLTI